VVYSICRRRFAAFLVRLWFDVVPHLAVR
jgi:hypothetical protein